MITEVDLHDEFLRDAHGEPIAERHRTDDPAVWGLYDVARGRTPLCPVTVYKRSGDSASGVAGRLTQDGVFHPIHSCRIGNEFTVGTLHDVRPALGEPTVTYVTAWDGAAPCDEFLAELHGGGTEERREHTRGGLLGDYRIQRDVDRGTTKQQGTARRTGLKPGTRSFIGLGGIAAQGSYVGPQEARLGARNASAMRISPGS